MKAPGAALQNARQARDLEMSTSFLWSFNVGSTLFVFNLKNKKG
ncbi:hypothetical protein BH10CHL1_BH10CHL1_29810 [soil metagenome]